MTTLNETEVKVLKAAAEQIIECTNGDFGYLSDCSPVNGLSVNQMKGYFGQLAKKDLIYVDEQFDQVQLTHAGLDALNETGFVFIFDFQTV